MRTLEEKYLNKKYNRLTIIQITDEFEPYTYNGKTTKKPIVICLCDCGVKKKFRLESVRGGSTKSCGCLRDETSKKNMRQAQALQFRRPPRLGSAMIVYRNAYNDGDIDFDTFVHMSQQNCFWCGKEPSNLCNPYKYNYTNPQCYYTEERKNDGDFVYNGLDRIDNTRGHDLDNVVTSCKDCNVGRMARTTDDFLSWIARIHERHNVHSST